MRQVEIHTDSHSRIIEGKDPDLEISYTYPRKLNRVDGPLPRAEAGLVFESTGQSNDHRLFRAGF